MADKAESKTEGKKRERKTHEQLLAEARARVEKLENQEINKAHKRIAFLDARIEINKAAITKRQARIDADELEKAEVVASLNKDATYTQTTLDEV